MAVPESYVAAIVFTWSATALLVAKTPPITPAEMKEPRERRLCFGIFPITAAIMFVSFVVLTIISDYVTVPTILAVVFVPIGMYFFDYQLVSVVIVSSYSLLSIYKHWPNIIKIIKKEEVGLRAVFKKD